MTDSYTGPRTPAHAASWADEAACRGYALADFFTESKTGIARAKRICAPCPVRERCLSEALGAEDSSRYGISGGLTPEERTDLVKGNGPAVTVPLPPPPKTGRPPAECGTRSAYQRHLKKGEPIDASCRRANTEANQLLRATGSTRAAR